MEGKDYFEKAIARLEKVLMEDHDLLIKIVATSEHNTKQTQSTLDNIISQLKELSVSIENKADHAELKVLETKVELIDERVVSLESTHQSNDDRREGVKQFFGIAWKAWGVLTGIILFFVSLFTAAANM